MSDRFFFPLIALAALLVISLSLVWPQGAGRRSPRPFGHATASEIAARTPKLRPANAPAPAAGPTSTP
jgi:hypothetical protein